MLHALQNKNVGGFYRRHETFLSYNKEADMGRSLWHSRLSSISENGRGLEMRVVLTPYTSVMLWHGYHKQCWAVLHLFYSVIVIMIIPVIQYY